MRRWIALIFALGFLIAVVGSSAHLHLMGSSAFAKDSCSFCHVSSSPGIVGEPAFCLEMSPVLTLSNPRIPETPADVRYAPHVSESAEPRSCCLLDISPNHSPPASAV